MDSPLFTNLVRLLKLSRHKEVRKIIIRLMKVPSFVREPIDPKDLDYENKMEVKKNLIRMFGIRMMDSEPDVRREAYLKLIHLNIKIEDFDCPETRMVIFKEGMTDSDLKVKNACVQFLTPSIIR